VNPLSLMYGAVSGARNLVYDTGWFTARLQGPVVSVGNISAGWTGKTPFIIYLGEQLKQRGIKFDVLSRGYGRASRGVRVVDASGSARDFGDEPLLIARKLEVPVVVGESRYHAGLVAEQKFGPQLHLLEDGFQHRQLHRDLDIVLLGEGDLEDQLLPAGRLREPVSALARADMIITADSEYLERLRSRHAMVLWLRRAIQVGESDPGVSIAFCGIARPQRFFSSVRESGLKIAQERAFRDHHAYSAADAEELQKMRAASGAQGFVTTEKDELNLAPVAAGLYPRSIVKVKVWLDRPEELLEAVTKVAGGRKAAKS